MGIKYLQIYFISMLEISHFTIFYAKLQKAFEGEVSQYLSATGICPTEVQIIMETIFHFRCFTFDILSVTHGG